MKKLIFLLVFTIFLINFVGAETFEQNKILDFQKTCVGTNNTICSSSATCNVTIKYPRNNTPVVNSQPMTNNANGFFNYTLNAGQVNVLGEYNWDMLCCDGSTCGDAHGTFDVTKTGVILSQDKALIYLGLLALLVLILIASLTFASILPSGNIADDQGFLIGISNLKYFKYVLWAFSYGITVAILFTSSNIAFLYLETTMMGNLLFNLYRILMGLSPIIVILTFILIFYKIFQDKETKEMIERGVPLQRI